MMIITIPSISKSRGQPKTQSNQNQQNICLETIQPSIRMASHKSSDNPTKQNAEVIRQYFALTQQYRESMGPQSIVFMQVGAFYEVYGFLPLQKNTVNLEQETEDDADEIDTKQITGSNIVVFGECCELAITPKSKVFVDGKQIVMAGFKDIYLDRFIKKMQAIRYTVVVYDQDKSVEPPTRYLLGCFSPGTYFQASSTALSNQTACVWIEKVPHLAARRAPEVVVGMSAINIFTGRIECCQFREPWMHSPTTYDELERFLSVCRPSEMICISNTTREDLNLILQYVGVHTLGNCLLHHVCTEDAAITDVTRTKVANCEKQHYQKEILTRYFGSDWYRTHHQEIGEYTISTQALCYLLDFIHQRNPHLLSKVAAPVYENYSTRVVLGNHSLKQLNILDDGTTESGKFSCIVNLLNECKTAMGRRLLEQQLVHPVYDVPYLQREYDITELLLTASLDTIRQPLCSIRDLDKCKRMLCLRKIMPKQLYYLYKNAHTILQLYQTIQSPSLEFPRLNAAQPGRTSLSFGSPESPCLSALWTYLCQVVPDTPALAAGIPALIQYIQTHFEIEHIRTADVIEFQCMKLGVNTGLDASLMELSISEAKLHAIAIYCSQLIEAQDAKGKKSSKKVPACIDDNTEGLMVKIHETATHHFSITTTKRRSELLLAALPEQDTVIQLIANNEGNILVGVPFSFTVSKSRFTMASRTETTVDVLHPDIQQTCAQLHTFKKDSNTILTRLYASYVTGFDAFHDTLHTLSQFVGTLDVILTKAHLALTYHYCRPVLQESSASFVQTTGLRHVLIERLLQNEIYVSNDVTLGASPHGLLLFGTNAVGKSSFIRSIGVAVLMAQAGFFVPCTTFVFSPYRHLFTRIVGNDNIFKGLSTFAVEMSELRVILERATEHSLILGDELCSGTETQSAISIFVAGIEHLHAQRSSFIFATHLHEIVDYPEITALQGCSTVHMEVIYDRERDALIYGRKLKPGSGTSMYGLEVCKSLHLPAAFIERAYNIRAAGDRSKQLLTLPTSRHNGQKVMGMCEQCHLRPATEVHHRQHQARADPITGFIATERGTFHKNALGNLAALCEECHLLDHKEHTEGSFRITEY